MEVARGAIAPPEIEKNLFSQNWRRREEKKIVKKGAKIEKNLIGEKLLNSQILKKLSGMNGEPPSALFFCQHFNSRGKDLNAKKSL